MFFQAQRFGNRGAHMCARPYELAELCGKGHCSAVLSEEAAKGSGDFVWPVERNEVARVQLDDP